MILDRSLSTIVAHLQKGLQGRIRTKWPVSLVEHSDACALLHGPCGEALILVQCDGRLQERLSHCPAVLSSETSLTLGRG